jgi:hypothetical protein
MSDYTYPNEFIIKTQKRIQSQLNGNGVDPKETTLTVKRQGVGTLGAQTLFSFDCQVETKTNKGRQNIGRQVTQGTMQAEVQKFISGIQSRDDMEQVAKNLLKKSPHEGFGLDKQVFDIPSEKTILCEHQNCGRCGGQGQAKCHVCQGQGRCQCNLCHGQGLMQCMSCRGVGSTQNQTTNEQQICTQCQGRRETYCTNCQGQRTTSCGTCNTSGLISCKDCGGEGAQSIVATITPTIKTSAIINLPDLDDDCKNMVAKIGAHVLAKGNHIVIKNVSAPVIEDEEERAYYQDEPEEAPKNSLYYTANIEWAVAEINGEGSKRNIYFVGSKGAVANSDPFMKPLFEKPLSLMKRAASGDGFVAGLLKDTCEYRVSRETLECVVGGNKKKAMIALKKTYGLGTTPDMFQAFVINGFKALKKITQRPRYIGLGLGLILSALLSYQWFIGDLRINTVDQATNIRYVLDMVSMIFCMMMSFVFIKGLGFFALQSVMKDIGLPNTKMPAMGKAGMYAIIGNVLIWGLGLSSLFTNFY